MKQLHWYILLMLLPLLVGSCENRLTDDPSARFSFSTDTLRFDTVFTTAGSATKTLLIYNTQKRALDIRSARLAIGKSFKVNMDGEQDLSQISHLQVAGGDSLFLFVRASIDPADRTQPLLVQDKLLLEVGDHTEEIVLEAYGWDVHLVDSMNVVLNKTLTADKPWLIRRCIEVRKTATLTIEPGAYLFMHDNAYLLAKGGGIQAKGTQEAPIRILSDRLDDIYPDIPYLYVGGRWDGIYLQAPKSAQLENVEILSGNVGLYLQGSGSEKLTLHNSRIHNHTLYGVAITDADAVITNTEVSNCAEYCMYLSGGRFHITHSTIASFFNNTRYAIQTTTRVDTISPLYINNLSKAHAKTEVYLRNSVLAGMKKRCLMLATPFREYYAGEFVGCWLQTDSIPAAYAHHNIYHLGHCKDLFRCDYYEDKKQYYDFRLDSLSPARNIADSLIATELPTDRNGRDRMADGKPDAGCYEY